jgi:hypothetical protein
MRITRIGLRRVAARFGLLGHVLQPPLFAAAVYIIVVSSMVLAVGR